MYMPTKKLKTGSYIYNKFIKKLYNLKINIFNIKLIIYNKIFFYLNIKNIKLIMAIP
jgi:hypothetical protein